MLPDRRSAAEPAPDAERDHGQQHEAAGEGLEAGEQTDCSGRQATGRLVLQQGGADGEVLRKVQQQRAEGQPEQHAAQAPGTEAERERGDYQGARQHRNQDVAGDQQPDLQQPAAAFKRGELALNLGGAAERAHVEVHVSPGGGPHVRDTERKVQQAREVSTIAERRGLGIRKCMGDPMGNPGERTCGRLSRVFKSTGH